jgi:hypothetical protein
VDSYSDAALSVNDPVDAAELDIPAFLPCRPLQAVAAKRRRRISPEVWGTVRARIAREHDALPADSPRVRPTLPRLRWLERPALGGKEAV